MHDPARTAASEQGSVDIGKLGLTLAPASRVAGAGAEGVVVTGVDSSGVAAEHGFTHRRRHPRGRRQAGVTPAEVRKAIGERARRAKRTVLMRVKSGDNTASSPLPVGSG